MERQALMKILIQDLRGINEEDIKKVLNNAFEILIKSKQQYVLKK